MDQEEGLQWIWNDVDVIFWGIFVLRGETGLSLFETCS